MNNDTPYYIYDYKTMKEMTMTCKYMQNRSIYCCEDGRTIVRKGEGEISMSTAEIARLFGVTWRKVDGLLQRLGRFSDTLGRDTCMERKGDSVVPHYPLRTVLALASLIDTPGAHAFIGHVCRRMERPANGTSMRLFLVGGSPC